MCPPRASTEMLRLRRIIRQLQIRVRELSQNLHMKRCLLSPIRRLPPELLQMVFLFAIPNRQWFLTVTQSAMDALRLAQVCSYWRTVALDTSKLWTGVLIRASTRHQSSIAHLEFYSSHAKASPLTVHCHKIPGRSFMKKLTSLSHRWSEILLTIGNSPLEELNAVRHKIPLLTSLSLRNLCGRDGTQTNDAFECAPSLRRVVLTINSGNVWPFSYILPWEQVTSLTLVPISQSVFSECIRNCPQLLYFHAIIRARPEELVQPITALPHSPLRKLVLQSLGVLNLDVLRPLSFPHLQSLGIDRILLHPVTGMLQPDLLAFLARSTHLEMLSIRGANVTTADLVVLLLAAPSLRMPHFRDWNTVMVTPKFNVSLVARALDDPFDAAPPQSLAELGVEGCTAYNEVELLRLMKMRAERHPSFDPYGIETARLCIEHVPFDGEAELDYLSHRY
ncbi:hypothetical protein K438DRAFT_1978062 [Mycena galopus ATCC 62051]|nr:hypothetical protein K438DRAFT_1978062 [Mycena galopus ATCC 62051]